MENKYEEFLKYIIDELVDAQDSVSIEKKKDDKGILLTLRVGKEDMGKIIGAKGETANAIRKILRGVGLKNDDKVSLVIEEPAQ